MKPILIKDLGVISLNKDKKPRHYAIYACDECNKEYKLRYVGEYSNNNCRSCSRSTHKLTNHKLFSIWTSMKERILNITHYNYPIYGGRGIMIDKGWNDNFKTFYDWSMNNGYKEGLSIDRIDNNGHYCPDNCRWTDIFTQNANKRKQKNCLNKHIGIEKTPYNKYRAKIVVKNKRINLGNYDNELDAVKARDKYIIDNDLPHTLSGV